MAETCCHAETPTQHCPECGERATTVDTATVKALLQPLALRRLGPGTFRFCANPTCDVVYFSEAHRYGAVDLRVAVWQKEPPGDRTVCYCFDENETDIRREIDATGTSGAPSRIRDHIAARRCACEARNPRGVCCLSDVVSTVVRLQADMHARVAR